ncbi:SMI1/KNR4 family protein [Rossellomorea sp. AcN35-11]|nr:SMI1/KNR4 family protein [Rossellomorea aquimaris]WJV28384.1 SMI1/KNR4 family protein [Rossellomorea sp. AcN35-11]
MYERVEEQLNIKLPVEYVNNYHKKLNKYNQLFLPDDKEIVRIREYCSLENEEDENYLLNVYGRNKNMLLDDLIPFAITEYDDYICFYYNKGRNYEPSIVYFSYDLAYEDRHEAIFYIANSFQDFTGLLK